MELTRITTFKIANLKKSDRQTNIDKYRIDAYRILSNSISEQKFDLLCN